MADSNTCPKCGRAIKVNKNGKLRKHKRRIFVLGTYGHDGWRWVPCEGSRQKPE